MAESASDRLWQEYGRVFVEFDDLTLARWLAQTLGQLQGRAWRYSHPLVGAYRLAADLAHQRQVWLKRLATPPPAFADSPCCRAPLLPLFTRDVMESGLICLHCSEAAVPFDDIPLELQVAIRECAAEYAPVHEVAHWEDRRRRDVSDYNQAYEDAALSAEKLLSNAARALIPRFLEHYPAIIWEDQDECLEVRPEDIET